MPRPASTVADEVQARARGLTAYVDRLERLHSEGRLSRGDVARAHAGALLGFYTFTEQSIERLFLGILMGRFATSGGATALVRIKSEVVARSVVSGGRRYVDWLPYEHSRKRAEAFFSTGRPFADLSPADTAAFERLTIIRNAIAHQSTFAAKRFKRVFVEGRALPPDQQGPIGYLMGQHRPGVTRFENTLAEVVLAFSRLCV